MNGIACQLSRKVLSVAPWLQGNPKHTEGRYLGRWRRHAYGVGKNRVTKRKEPLMAGSSLFALLDDIATLLDDISLMSKVAAKKSASVLSDDLAVNAEQVTGMKADRELPVVWAVFKGSLRTKQSWCLVRWC